MRYIAVMFTCLVLAACVRLTPAGERVQVVSTDQAGLVSGCRHLSSISVSSRDALKNATAAEGGDTAVMNLRDVGTTQYIQGEIYHCAATGSNSSTTSVPHEPSPEEKAEAEYRRKSGLCQAKGGVWINHQCVIAIE